MPQEIDRTAAGITPPPALAARWVANGWPAALLARGLGAGIGPSHLARMLEFNPPVQRAEEEIVWAERLRDGNIRFRQLTPADDDAFRELWANSPEAIGDFDVTVERGPNAFAQFELQERPVLNGLFDGPTMVACVSFAIRRTVAGGDAIIVHYGQAMRVHQAHRGRQYAHWVRSLPWAVGIGRPTHLQYDYIRPGNMTMEGWNRKFMPDVATVPKRADEVPGVPVTVLQFPAHPQPGGSPGARLARLDDLERCAALINRTHAGRDLFRPYTLPSLLERLDAGLTGAFRAPWRRPYGLEDFYVIEDGGEVVACAGLWDRGRDAWERWRHRESGEERVVSVTSLLDFGCAAARPDALARLIEHLIGVTHELRRDYLVAPLATVPGVAELLAHCVPMPDTRYLQWRAERPTLTPPPYVDLVYW